MQVKLNNVRLSFPHLWEAKASEDGGDAKFSASFLMDKTTNADAIEAIKDAMLKVANEKWPVKVPNGVKKCLRDGSEKDHDGYGEDVMFVSAGNKVRVPVVDRDRSIPLSQADGRPYAGCYVNGVIRLWAQDNQFGKRINAQLQAVQFVRDGEPFGDKPVSAEEVFSNVGEEQPHGGSDFDRKT